MLTSSHFIFVEGLIFLVVNQVECDSECSLGSELVKCGIEILFKNLNAIFYFFDILV